MPLNRFHALCVLGLPVMLTAGIVTIPVVSNYSNHLLAEEAAIHTARWFWGHLIAGVAFGFSILVAHSVSRLLISRGQAGLATISLSAIAIGGSLFIFGLGADGIGPLAIVAGGGRALAYFDGSAIWVSSTFIAASIIFGLGLSQVLGIFHTDLLKGLTRIIVFLAAILFTAACAIPSGWGLYVVAAASLIVYLPIGTAIWHNCGT